MFSCAARLSLLGKSLEWIYICVTFLSLALVFSFCTSWVHSGLRPGVASPSKDFLMLLGLLRFFFLWWFLFCFGFVVDVLWGFIYLFI